MSIRSTFEVDPDTIYNELVPFGPAFRSICRPLAITPAGVVAEVKALGSDDDPLLGSPFPLDGAFHAACVWGQRHAGIVAFPVGIQRRTVCLPTVAGESYLARITPVQQTGPILKFDIRLWDHEGRLREAAQGVEMRDVSRGRWLPPAWIIRQP